MKTTLGLIVLLSSTAAFAQRMNQCPRAGVVLSSEFMRMTGDLANIQHVRLGTSAIPTVYNVSGNIVANTYRLMRETVCVEESYTHQERICNDIHPDLAFGRGNQLINGFFDLRLNPLTRAENFSRNVRYNMELPARDRLEIARQVLTAITGTVAEAGQPRSWMEFSGLLNKAVTDGLITLHLADEITKVHAIQNRQHLGFNPLEGVTVTENRGNGSLSRALNLGVSPDSRARMLKDMINGLSPRDAQTCAQSFVQFAAANGIPHSWQAFELMIQDSVVKGVLTAKDQRRITVDNEEMNRRSLGFEMSIIQCHIENQRRIVNVIQERQRPDFAQAITKRYEISVTNAPLVNGEQESVNVSFDGLNPMRVGLSSSYNEYAVSQAEDAAGIKYTATGSRKKITPANTLQVSYKRKDKTSSFDIQYPQFNEKVAPKILVKVVFYDAGGLFGIGRDKELGAEVYEITNGNMNKIVAKIQNKKVDYVKVSMQIVGSAYHNSDFSEEIKLKD